MIRYALAVVLAVTLLGLGVTALDHGATLRGESQAATAIEQIDAAAVDLYQNEQVPVAGEPPPQRLVEVTLPGEGLTSDAPTHLTFDPAVDENLTRVTYRFSGRAERSHVVAAPLVSDSGGPFQVEATGETTLRLRLVAGADGAPVVAVAVDKTESPNSRSHHP